MTLFRNIGLFKKYFIRYKWWIIGGTFAMLCTDVLALLIPWLIKSAIDIIKNGYDDASVLVTFGISIGTCTIILAAFRFLWQRIIHDFSRYLEVDIRNEFIKHLQTLNPSYYDNRQTGDLMNRATSDIESVRVFMDAGLSVGSDTAIILITSIPLMFYINVTLTLYVFIPLPFLVFFARYGSQIIHNRYKKYQEKHSDLTARIQENFAGMRVVKAYTQEEKEKVDFDYYNKRLVNRGMHLVKILGIFEPILVGAIGVGDFILLFIGGPMVLSGEISLGNFFLFTWLFHWVSGPMIGTGWIMTIYSQACGAMERLNEILKAKTTISEAPDANKDISINGEIEFRNVSLRYSPEMPYVLKNINLKIPQGKTLAIVGPTGSGKSSLVNLIPRWYDVTEGQLLIDGVDVRKIQLSTLRNSIGYAPQDVFLFSETLEENIAFGIKKEYTEETIRKAAEISQIAASIEEFPEQYKTMIGERGVTLSGGQKQRTAISRAIVTDPKILILDDSLSSVDTHTEEEILTRLHDVMKNRTSIIISHRISTVKNADMIIVIDDGKIVEQGTHQELIALNGIYSNINEKQSLTTALGLD